MPPRIGWPQQLAVLPTKSSLPLHPRRCVAKQSPAGMFVYCMGYASILRV